VSVGLFFPAIVAMACGVAAGLIRWRLRPMLAVRLLTVIAVVVAATFAAVVVTVIVGFAARSALVMSLIEWCPVVPLHHQVTVVEGTVAVLVLGVAGARTRRILRRRRLASTGTEGRSLSIVESREPVAYAAPGDPGCVVISRGLLDILSPRERQVVLAHERAHLHWHHHRYLVAAEISLAIVPLLGSLVGQIRLATERSADESAAAALGGDRRLVARTIARAALSRSVHHGLVGAFGGASIPTRINALIGPAQPTAVAALAIGAIGATAVTAVAAGSMQFHHLAELIEHVCSY
jgi:Zn-dependent protease with chaperone function